MAALAICTNRQAKHGTDASPDDLQGNGLIWPMSRSDSRMSVGIVLASAPSARDTSGDISLRLRGADMDSVMDFLTSWTCLLLACVLLGAFLVLVVIAVVALVLYAQRGSAKKPTARMNRKKFSQDDS
jgi:hypothetical protein